MTELEIIKQAKEALLMCANRVDPRSPAGKKMKKTLEMINTYLNPVKFSDSNSDSHKDPGTTWTDPRKK